MEIVSNKITEQRGVSNLSLELSNYLHRSYQISSVSCVTLEVFMAVTIQIVIPCSLLGVYQHFGTPFIKIEEASSSEKLVNTYHTIRRHNQKHYNSNPISVLVYKIRVQTDVTSFRLLSQYELLDAHRSVVG
jgi:hypothetical protein